MTVTSVRKLVAFSCQAARPRPAAGAAFEKQPLEAKVPSPRVPGRPRLSTTGVLSLRSVLGMTSPALLVGFDAPTTFTTSKGVRLVYQMRTQGPTVRVRRAVQPCTPRAQRQARPGKLPVSVGAYRANPSRLEQRLCRCYCASEGGRVGAKAACNLPSCFQLTAYAAVSVGTRRSSHEKLDCA